MLTLSIATSLSWFKPVMKTFECRAATKAGTTASQPTAIYTRSKNAIGICRLLVPSHASH